jgi:hypothetical protein
MLTPRLTVALAAMLSSLVFDTPALAVTTAPVTGATGVAVNTATHTFYGLENLTGSSGTVGAVAVFTSTNPSVVAKTISVGYNPFAIAVNANTNTIYVVNYGPTATPSTTVTVISGATNSVTATISGLPTNASAIAVNPTTNRIYVACGAGASAQYPGTLWVINGSTLALTSLGVGYNPSGVAVNPATNRVYVSNAGSTYGSPSVTIFNGATNALVANLSTPSNAAPAGLAVDGAANRIYIASSTGLLVLNGATRTFVTTVVFGANLQSVAVDHHAGLVFVNSSSLKNTYTVRIATLTAGTTILGPAVGSSHPTSIAVDPSLQRVFDASSPYVTLYNETQFIVPQAPTAPTLTPGSQLITVNWSAPKNLGPAISYYDVLVSTSANGPYAMSTSSLGSCYKNVTVPTTSCTIGGLTTGVTYYVEVEAASTAGFGPVSPYASATSN